MTFLALETRAGSRGSFKVREAVINKQQTQKRLTGWEHRGGNPPRQVWTPTCSRVTVLKLAHGLSTASDLLGGRPFQQAADEYGGKHGS